jgi:hypothetical protein
VPRFFREEERRIVVSNRLILKGIARFLGQAATKGVKEDWGSNVSQQPFF